MRKISFTLFFALFAASTCLSQSLYKEGFILNSPFDTIRGQVKYRSYNKASLKCIFVDSLGQETTYQPTEIFGYGIEDQLFFRSKTIGADKTQFLEVVYQGTMILYAYRDASQKNHFYLENPTNGQFEILNQKTIRNQGRMVVIRSFEEVLRDMLPKSELIEDEISSVPYEHSALSNLLLDYDLRYASFQGRVFKGFKKRWPPKIAAFVQTGNSQLTLNGFDQKSKSNTFGFGVKFQKEISRGTGRLHLDLDIAYHYESFDDVEFIKEEFATPESVISNGFNIALFAIDLGIQGPYSVSNKINLERHVISTPINLKYFIPSRKWTFSLNMGLHPSYAVSQSGNVDGQVIQNEEVILGVNSRLTPNKFRPGVNYGMGVYLKTRGTWFIDLQHSPSLLDQGNSNFAFLNLRLGYLFN